jgi:hypothetical protein
MLLNDDKLAASFIINADSRCALVEDFLPLWKHNDGNRALLVGHGCSSFG